MCTGLVTSNQTAGTLTVNVSSVCSQMVSTVDTTINATSSGANLNICGPANYTVTGAGTIAMSLNEIVTHTTGSLTVTSAGAAALTIVEDASGLGAVIVTTGGTGTVSLAALTTHVSHTINLNI